jgi:DNA-directed RNA polymerase specialized sigma24 family protein
MFRHTGAVIAAPVVMDPSELDRHFRTFQRQRDPAALAAVFDAAAPRLLLVAMHLGRDAATAEDPVQTVFLPVLRDAERCAPGRPVLPWRLGAIEQRRIDARRLAHRRRERAGPEVVGSAHGVADAAGTPPDLAADAEGRAGRPPNPHPPVGRPDRPAGFPARASACR